jgi:hypothetical protein
MARPQGNVDVGKGGAGARDPFDGTDQEAEMSGQPRRIGAEDYHSDWNA